jgi:hypothetical protein
MLGTKKKNPPINFTSVTMATTAAETSTASTVVVPLLTVAVVEAA